MAEPTATNANGEKVVYRGGQWVPLGGAAPVAPAPSFPGVIQGRPKQPDPIELERLRIAQEGAERAQRGEARLENADARQQAQFDGTGGQGTADEKKIATLVTRVAGGLSDIQGVTNDDPAANAPGLVEGLRGNLSPGGVGGIVTRAIAGPGRRAVNDAQRDMLDALLTLGTGAAYAPEQLNAAVAAHFPQYGDSPEEAKIKLQRLQRVVEAAKANAGPAWARVEPAIAPYLQSFDIGGGQGPADNGEEGLSGHVTYEGPNPADPSPTNLGPDGQPRVDGNSPGYAQLAAGVGNIVEGGVNNTIGLLGTPVNSTINAAFGTNLGTNLGASLRQAMGLPYSDPTTDAVQQAITGGLAGAGLASKAAQFGGGLVSNALAQYGSRPLMDAATGGTAAFSGEMARQAGAGPVGQAAAIIAGGATPNALSGLSRAATRAPAGLNREVVAAGERVRVPVRQADAIPSRRGDVANLETSQRGGPIIQQGRAADNALIEQRVGEVGGDGAALEPYPHGQQVQGAGKRYIARTRAQADALYKKAEELSQGQRVVPQRAIAAVDQQLAELRAAGESSNGALIAHFEGLKKDLSKPEGFSIREFQGLRSANRNKIKGDTALTSSDADRRLGIVVKEFTADAGDQLPDAASSALDQADGFYAQRQDFINNTLKSLMGTKGKPLRAEDAATRLVSMTKGKGDYDRFSRMWGELSPEERADTAATIAQSLGRKPNGEFSPSTLVTSLDPRTGINPRTARLIFGEEGARALQDLRAISQAKTATANALNNSRTGTVVQRAAGGMKTLIMTALGFSAGGLGGAVAAPVAQGLLKNWGEARAARALMNPDFTKMLRQMPETTNPKAMDGYFRRMAVQAAKSPILADDVRGFQDALRGTFANDNMPQIGSAVASPGERPDDANQ